jgi:prepilin-type N-terminal cleavage/methylation domain-containing protein
MSLRLKHRFSQGMQCRSCDWFWVDDFFQSRRRQFDSPIGGMNPNRAFTIIELLVTIAIIAILAALLFAVTVRIRSPLSEKVCRNNLGQIVVAMQLYRNDNEGQYPLLSAVRGTTGEAFKIQTPARPTWSFRFALGGKTTTNSPPEANRPLFKYVKAAETFRCKDDKGYDVKLLRGGTTVESIWKWQGCSYGYNPVTGLRVPKAEGISNPSKVVLVYEYPGWNIPMEVILWHRFKRRESLPLEDHYKKGRQLVTPYLFVDGHAEVVLFKQDETPRDSNRISWRP